jgi:hypothetical protein
MPEDLPLEAKDLFSRCWEKGWQEKRASKMTLRQSARNQHEKHLGRAGKGNDKKSKD